MSHGPKPIVFKYGGTRDVPATEGDTVAWALLRAGIVATTRSPKYRRPRGPFCLSGDCGTCLVRIDGQPNVRSCMTRARHGMEVEPQNIVGAAGLDPTGVVDHALAGGMDHHHFMVRPKLANRAMQSVARELAGIGRLPDAPRVRPSSHHHHEPDVLVVGAGAAGRAAMATLLAAEADAMAMDRLDMRSLEVAHAAPLPAPVHTSTGVFGAYRADGVWAAVETHPGSALHVIRPRHVIVATGSRMTTLPIPNNDLPGVVTARGMWRQLRRRSEPLEPGCIVIGSGEVGRRWAEALDAPLLETRQVARLLGGARVEAVETRDHERHRCRWVALASPSAPAYELAAQAGATVAWNGHGFAVQRDERGRCHGGDGWTVWAAGEVCGPMEPEQAARDGHRVAEQVLEQLERKPHAG